MAPAAAQIMTDLQDDNQSQVVLPSTSCHHERTEQVSQVSVV